MTQARRPIYKSWLLWVVVIVLAGWPWVNDWAWDSAKEDAKTKIIEFETKIQAQAKAHADATQSVHAEPVEMSQLTCAAANSYFAPYWDTSSTFRAKLIQAFVWHGYGVAIPSEQSIKVRGCGETADGKYHFTGTGA